MGALKRTYWEALVQSIRELYNDRVRHEHCPITSDEVVTLFIRPEDYDICKRFKSLFPFNSSYYNSGKVYSGNTKFKYIDLSIVYGPYVFPVYNNSNGYGSQVITVQDNVPEELLSRYVAHLDWHMATWEEYNLMFRVLKYLDDICSSPSQIRFFWPAIDTLAQHAQKRDEKSNLVKMLGVNSKVPVPRISQKLREACQNTSATLTVLQMLGDAPRDADKAPVQFSPSMHVTHENTIVHGEFQ
jgi:hypothetical protein